MLYIYRYNYYILRYWLLRPLAHEKSRASSRQRKKKKGFIVLKMTEEWRGSYRKDQIFCKLCSWIYLFERLIQFMQNCYPTHICETFIMTIRNSLQIRPWIKTAQPTTLQLNLSASCLVHYNLYEVILCNYTGRSTY